MHSRRYGAALALVAGLIVALIPALVPAGSAGAHAPAKRKASFSLSTDTVTSGESVVVRGRVTASPRRTKVLVQLRSGSRWVTVARTRTTTRAGAFRATLTTSGPGVTSYRVRAPRTRQLPKATSKPRTLTVLPRTTPGTPGAPGTPEVPRPPSLSLVSRAAGSPAAGNDPSGSPSISADGRHVAFVSTASDLVPGDTNGEQDVFVRDLVTGVTTLVSHGPGGVPANDPSYPPSISGNGRYVAYPSAANNLDPDDTNAETDVFLWDRETDTSVLVSRASGARGAVADDYSAQPSVADDGSVAFASRAGNLGGVHVGDGWDVFVRVGGSTDLVSTAGVSTHAANSDSWAPSISDDGRVVVFSSYATDMQPLPTGGHASIYRYDIYAAPVWELISRPAAGGAPDGGSDYADVSADGRYVTYESAATNLAGGGTGTRDVFVTDATTMSTTLISRTATGAGGNADATQPAISADGAYVAFTSEAGDLVEGDRPSGSDVFVAPVAAGPVLAVSRTGAGEWGNGWSERPAISGSGLHVAFQTQSSNFSADDPAALTFDVYRWNRSGNG